MIDQALNWLFQVFPPPEIKLFLSAVFWFLITVIATFCGTYICKVILVKRWAPGLYHDWSVRSTAFVMAMLSTWWVWPYTYVSFWPMSLIVTVTSIILYHALDWFSQSPSIEYRFPWLYDFLRGDLK